MKLQCLLAVLMLSLLLMVDADKISVDATARELLDIIKETTEEKVAERLAESSEEDDEINDNEAAESLLTGSERLVEMFEDDDDSALLDNDDEDIVAERWLAGGVRSCKEIKARNHHAHSGRYKINTNIGEVEVYCEMTLEGGAFTFIPKWAVSTRNSHGESLDLSRIFRDKKNVLLFIRWSNGNIRYTLINQLSSRQNTPMGAHINSYRGYTKPLNLCMGDYLYFGILPHHLAAHRNTQGFTSNKQQLTFHNCDANPNSYFALYPNFNNQPVNQYGHLTRRTCHWEVASTTMSRRWRHTAIPVDSAITGKYFFFTEMHIGGCGTYADTTCMGDINGVAIGFR